MASMKSENQLKSSHMDLIAPMIGILMSPLGATLTQSVKVQYQRKLRDGKTRLVGFTAMDLVKIANKVKKRIRKEKLGFL